MLTNSKTYKYLTFILCFLVAIASLSGILIDTIYARERLSYAAQGRGQDLVNLLIVVPLLFYTSLQLSKKSIKIFSLWLGGIVYTLYTYTLYSFAMHFNPLFLLYTAIFGLSFYLFVSSLIAIDLKTLSRMTKSLVPNKLTKIYLLLVPILFYLVWLKEIIPSTINNEIPESAAELGLLVNAVHVLDIGLFLPGLIVTYYLFRKNNIYGKLLAPSLISFSAIMSTAILSMVFFMLRENIDVEIPMIVIFVAMLIFSIITLKKYYQNFD